MFKENEMKYVPAYFATNRSGARVPFIVALIMVNEQQHAVLPPAVTESIDRTMSITEAEGVAFANIRASDCIETVVLDHVRRAITIPDAMVLFRCEGPETAEQLMIVMNKAYTLTLVKDQRGVQDD